MNPVIGAWRHIFKLDPDKKISDEDLERICLSGTGAVMVGGSSGVTYHNTVGLLSRIRRYEVPCVLEVSTLDAVVPGFDLYFIPTVLNTDDARWITGYHQRALRDFGAFVNWDLIVPEGYVILNDRSAAAKLTGARKPGDAEELAAYAKVADRLFRMPVFYVEYSGEFGDMDWVRKAKSALGEARLFYGGGIRDARQAALAAEAAHTIVVGNVIYEDIDAALSTVLH